MPTTSTYTEPKYAIYFEVADRGWLVDTGVGGTWSWNVNDATWFETVQDAIDALHACDIVDRGVDPRTLGYTFPRVR